MNNTIKRLLLLAGVLAMLSAATIEWQALEGVILYEVKVNMHRRLNADQEAMKDVVPEYNVFRDELFFNATESLYKPIEEDDDDLEVSQGPMRMRFMRPKSELYCNAPQSRRVLQQEFMGKKYLIDDSIRIAPWKLGTETKVVLGHTCKQASYFDERRKQQVVAWYTDQLRAFMGPEGFNSLPGTVLLVDINNGERIIEARKIDARPMRKNELRMPAGGQRISQAEFDKMQEEQMQRMRANGGMVIRN